MSADDYALLGLVLGVSVLAGTALARRTGVPDPVALVLAGLAASLLPAAATVSIPPEVVFLVFLPPLVFRSSFLTDPLVLARIATPLALLSVGLVAATAFTVALVAQALVPGLSFAEGLLLGAVVAPTDTVAPAAVFRRLTARRFVVDVVEGESLINDATALVLYAIALDAVLQGPPTAQGVALQLVVGLTGGALVGLLVGTLVLSVRRRIDDVGLQLLLSLFTPYAAYVAADRLGASGVLAVVVTGLLLAGSSGGMFGPTARLQSTAFWSLLELVLNAGLFVLLGLQVPRVLEDAPDLDAGVLALASVAVVATVVLVRLAWQFLIPAPVYGVRRLLGRPAARSSRAERLVIGWTGMRGAISLAAALALPLSLDDRPLLLFVTTVVVLTTLLVQGTTLPLLLRRTGLADDDSQLEESRQARLRLTEVALARLDELESRGELEVEAAWGLRQVWEQSRARLTAEDEHAHGHGEALETDLVAVRLDLTDRQGEELDRLRTAHALPTAVVNELQQELDLQRVRLQGRER